MYSIIRQIKSNLNYEGLVNNLFVLMLLVFLTLVGWKFIDPDYGWRFKTGEYILQNGIPTTDIYTYTMPSFPWVDHAWPQDVVMYLTHTLLGEGVQSSLWALVAIAALLISTNIYTKLAKNNITLFKNIPGIKLSTANYVANIFLLLGFLSLLDYFGVRVQVATWLMFAVFISLLLNRKLWLRFRKFTPLFFLVWAILHGGFASGLAAYFVYFVFRTFRIKKIDHIDLLFFVVSILATLLNPYGISLWREVWSSVSDSQIGSRIQEWRPFIFSPTWPTSFLMGISSIFIFIYRRSFKLEEIALFLFFFAQAMLSTRHVPLWVMVAIPLGTKALYMLYKESLKYKHGKERFILFYKIMLGLVYFIFVSELVYKGLVVVKADEGSFYPKQAVEYLIEADYEGRMFSSYGWGGYLIWKYPEKKVYIDGRMPSWKWGADIPEETNSAAEDFFNLLEGKGDLKNEIEKYEIKTVLWSSGRKNTFWNIVGDRLKILTGFESEDQYIITEELEELGWEKVYEDSTAVIYRI